VYLFIYLFTGTKYKNTQYNNTQHNNTQHNNTQHNNTQHNKTQHNNTQRNMKNTYCLFQIKFITEYTNVQHIIITQI
jgi:hypothetical protein